MPDVNPYEQFVNPSAAPATPAPVGSMPGEENPYQQFIDPNYQVTDPNTGKEIPGKATVQGLQLIPSTVPKISWLDAVKGGVGNFAQSGADFFKSVYHAGTHPLETLGKAANITGAAAVGLDKSLGGTFLNNLTPEVQAMITSDYPGLRDALGSGAVTFPKMVETMKALGGHYAERYGDEDRIKLALRDHPVETLADLATVLAPAAGGARLVGAKGLAAGLEGAAAAVNPLSTDNFLARGVRNAIPIIDPLAKGVAGGVEKAFDVLAPEGILPPKWNPSPTRAAQNALVLQEAEDPVAVKNALADARAPRAGGAPGQTMGEVVPGSSPTAGQVAGETRFKAMGERAGENLSTAQSRIESQQMAARKAHIGKIATDPNEFAAAFQDPLDAIKSSDAAVKSREAEGLQNYSVAKGVTVSADPQLIDLFNRPSMDKVFDVARGIAKEEGRPFQMGENKPGRWVPDPYGQNIPDTWEPATFAKYTGEDLDRVKKAFDQLAYNKELRAKYAIDDDMAKALIGTRNKFIDWMEQDSKIPEYKHARERYALQSGIIDRMNARKFLQAKLDQGPDAFLAAMDNEGLQEFSKNVNASKSTGKQRHGSFSEVFKPDESKITGSVQADVERANKAAEEAAKAADHKGNLDSAASDYFGGGHIPVGQSVPLVRQVINALMSGADKTIKNNVSQAMLTPDAAEEILTNALARKAQLDKYKGNIKFLYKGATVAPGAYNALQATDEKKRNK